MRNLFLSFIFIAASISLQGEEEPFLKNIQQLTFPSMGFERAGEAYFSPDEKKIIFQAVPSGKEHYQMYVMDLESCIPQMVSTGKGACTCGFFHPNKEKIIFASSHEDENPQAVDVASGQYKWDLTPYMNIYEAGVDGTNMKQLTFGSAYHAECSYSPDGEKILFASNEDGTMNLYIMDANGENPRQVTHDVGCYNGGPFFSPDGGRILFRADREKPHYLQLYVIDTQGNNEKKLTNNNAVNWAPYWHPNGVVLAYTTSIHGHHRYEIYLMNIVTGSEQRLTNHPSFDGLPVFNHDGTKLMWTSKRGPDGTCQIFIADFTLPINLN